MCRFKYSKILAILSCLGGAACATTHGAQAPDLELTHLRDENSRLEREVTQLREEALKQQRVTREKCAPASVPHGSSNVQAKSGESEGEGTASATASSRSEGGKPALPVVKLSPDGTQPEMSVRPSVPSDEPEPPPGTRPVLKVRGEHEAWVYHRVVSEDEVEPQAVSFDATPLAASGAPHSTKP